MQEDGVADGEVEAAGDAHADQQAVGVVGKGLEAAVDDLGFEVGDVDVGSEVDAVGLHVVFAEIGEQDAVAADDGRGRGDARNVGERLLDDVGMLDAGDVFHAAADADGETALGIGVEGAHGGLYPVFDTDHAVHTEDGLDEITLETGGLRLGDDEKRDAKHDAGEAHEHGTLAVREETEGDLKVGRHAE